MNRYQKLIKNIAIFMVGNASTKIVLFLTIVLCTHFFSVEEFGRYEIVTQFGNLLLPFTMLGTTETILRFILDKNANDGQVISNVFFINICGLLITLLFYPCSFFFPSWGKYAYLVIFINLAQMLFIVGQQYAKGIGSNKVFVYSGIFEAFLQLLLTYGALNYFSDKISGCLIAVFWSYLLAAFYAFTKLKIWNLIACQYFNKKILKELMCYSLPLMPNSICWWITGAINRFFINYFVDLLNVGLYAVAAKVPAVVSTISSVVFQAWQISAVEEFDSKDKSFFFSKILNACLSIICVIVASLIVFTKTIMMLMAAPAYFGAWVYIPPMLIATIFAALQSFIGTNYMAAKATKGALYTTVLGAITSIFFNYLLIPHYKLFGAVIASIGSYFIVLIARLFGTRKYIKFFFDGKMILINFIGIGIIMIGVYVEASQICYYSVVSLLVMFSINLRYVMRLRSNL